jgi:serine/threonine-protein kinase
MSPQNILITFDGVVKIVDFGVAKAAGRSSQQTSAGQVKGKPPYMSPEQALGDPVDRRTDVFALGIILYQLTTGKHPFRGESDLVTLQNIVSDKPVVPPRAYDKQFPKLLNAAIMKALDRDPAKRFDNCADFEACLDEVFVKEVARARNEDVGKFVTDMLGVKGEERRKALKEAIASADERAAARNSLSDLGRPTAAEPFRTTPTSNPTAVPVQLSIGPSGNATSQATDDPSGLNLAPDTGFGSSVSAPRRRRARGWAAVVGTLAIAGGVGFAAVHSGNSEGPATPARPAAAQMPVSNPVAEPLEEQPKTDPPASEPEDVAPPEVPSAAASAHVVTHRVWKRPSSSKSPKPTEAKKKPPGGFVPPPVTDPGF